MADWFPTDNVIEYYNNADDLLNEDDIMEIDIKVSGWSKKFRIRALTFAQMTQINQKANITNPDTQQTEYKEDLFAFWTIVEGVVRPKFSFIKAQQLADKNGEFVKELADQIWALGRVSKFSWDAYVAKINEANELAKKEKK